MSRLMPCAGLIGLCLSLPLLAEEPAPTPSAEEQAMMAAYEKMGRVGDEHKQLAGYVGNWSYVNTMWMDPKAPPSRSTGTAQATAIWDGRYVEMTYSGEFNGESFTGRSLLGYDNLKGKYVATWIDSMSTGIFIAYGEHDPASKSTTYRGEMDDPMNAGQITPVREVFRWTDADHWLMEWYETHAGVESKTMEIAYTRR